MNLDNEALHVLKCKVQYYLNDCSQFKAKKALIVINVVRNDMLSR